MIETPAPALSVVIPVYLGAATIGELVGALRALEIEGGLEIVLVVDGSPDNSLDVCKQLAAEPGAPITLLSLSRNFGEHNAVMAGFARARGAYAITMDDDLQNPPAEVRRQRPFHDELQRPQQALVLAQQLDLLVRGPAKQEDREAAAQRGHGFAWRFRTKT